MTTQPRPAAVTRKLAAVVVADVVGYSRLMQRDEATTHRRLRSIFDDVVFPAVVRHGGRTVKTSGDGLLLEFASATAALRFAVEMQREMTSRNAATPRDERIEFRIGINLGDVIVDADDIAGDGVNVAARLEPLSDAGGICVSRAIREQVREDLGVEFVDLGDKRVKNMAAPIRVFRVVASGAAPRRLRLPLPVSALRRAAAAVVVLAGLVVVAWRLLPPTLGSATAPGSVAVLPFTTQESEGQVVALTRSLGPVVTRMLANSMRDATIVGGTEPGPVHSSDASTRYRLAGDVRAWGDQVVVTANLVDALTKKEVDSEQRGIERARVDKERDLLAARVTAAVRQMIERVETRRLAAGPRDDPRAIVARAAAVFKGDVPSARAARKLYEEAIDRDPSLVSAWLGHLYTLDAEYWLDLTAGRDPALVDAMERDSVRALDLDDRDPRVWFARQVALEAQWRWEAALEAHARAHALDPSRFGEPILLLILAGRPQEALERIAVRSARMGRAEPDLLYAACNALLHLGRYEDALRECERAVADRGDYWSYLDLVAAYANAGDEARAKAAKDQLLHEAPGFTISRLLAKRFSDSPAWSEGIRTHFVPAWRRAGVPD